jgi:hypothetical protein
MAVAEPNTIKANNVAVAAPKRPYLGANIIISAIFIISEKQVISGRKLLY